MTNRLPPLSTQIVAPGPAPLPSLPPHPLGPTPSAQNAALNGAAQNTAQNTTQNVTKQEAVDEEPYTIKCICNFSDDDGNTIYCETCDTWQHIECFYPENLEDALREDFSHFCAECKPRDLDRQKARERQTARLNMPLVEETTDKKSKRPPSKSHKRKPKPTDLQLNGQTPSNEHTKNPPSHDHPPAKKAKSSHKSSHSVGSQVPKKSPPVSTAVGRNNSNNHVHHPPSPATTPPDLPNDVEIHNYSSNFLHLYDEQGLEIVQTNSFVMLNVSNAMSSWPRNPDAMRIETGLEYGDVYQKLPESIDSSRRNLQIEHKTVPLPSGAAVHWQYLTAPSAIDKDVPLMELNGQIGFQKDYCADPANRWDELTSPLPFVFFHPMLPLYIDTRKEGSRARYVRRSCKPNALLDTYLSEGPEYHFWLVSDRPIAAKEQITIPWDFRFPLKDKPRMLRLLGLGDEEMSAQGEPELDEVEYQTIASWVHLVLSEHGGCACDLGQDCAFARFHRNHHAGTHPRPSAPKKKRKPKIQHALSPTSTGHATNSRAASEGHLDDATDIEVGSQSGSARSKPPSRDMTPARQGSFDTLGILTEPTDRDKRKVAMVEDSFRRMEQQQQPPRKKKRTSEGSGTSKSKPTNRASTATTTTNLPNGTADRQYVDAGTSRGESGSPSSAISIHRPLDPSGAPSTRQGSVAGTSRAPSVSPRSGYCDAAVQTDPVKGEWYSGCTPSIPTPKRRVVSLSKRLLEARYWRRLDGSEKRKGQDSLATSLPEKVTDAGSPSPDPNQQLRSPSLNRDTSNVVESRGTPSGPSESNDIVMVDASPPSRPPNESNELNEPKMPVPATEDVTPAKNKSPDLRVQMPPVPMFGSPTSAVSTSNTPFSANGTTAQSPLGITGLPSPFGTPPINGMASTSGPVKKKMSLSDYRSRMHKAQATRPSVGTTVLKPSKPNADEPKSASSLDTAGTGPGDSPTAEKGVDAGAATTDKTPS